MTDPQVNDEYEATLNGRRFVVNAVTDRVYYRFLDGRKEKKDISKRLFMDLVLDDQLRKIEEPTDADKEEVLALDRGEREYERLKDEGKLP